MVLMTSLRRLFLLLPWLATSMLMMVAAVAPPLTQCDENCTDMAMKGDIQGAHLHITMIHATDFVDMVDKNAAAVPLPNAMLNDPEDWTGFHIDLLKWVAERAGFTYTLYPPSGNGSHCSIATDGSDPVEYSYQYAVQYNCGQDDVIENNRTHVYWSMYYITPPRLELSTFTAPFYSDGGITVVVKTDVEKSSGEELRKLLEPFTNEVWQMILVMLLVVSFTMWFIEHPYIGSDDVYLADEATPERFEAIKAELGMKNKQAVGFCQLDEFVRSFPESFSHSVKALTAMGGFETRTNLAGVYNMLFCIFAFIMGAACKSLSSVVDRKGVRVVITNLCIFFNNNDNRHFVAHRSPDTAVPRVAHRLF
jgi:ABC-type amino acid transport substrate-binding protein